MRSESCPVPSAGKKLEAKSPLTKWNAPTHWEFSKPSHQVSLPIPEPQRHLHSQVGFPRLSNLTTEYEWRCTGAHSFWASKPPFDALYTVYYPSFVCQTDTVRIKHPHASTWILLSEWAQNVWLVGSSNLVEVLVSLGTFGRAISVENLALGF